MKRRYKALSAAAIVAGGIYLMNASWLAPKPSSPLSLMAHRGVHQTYTHEGVSNDSCTASMIRPIEHDYIENTLPSMRAAANYGADIIELDIHPTTDGEFVVFHDWTLECRTNGRGKARDHSLADLKALDVGYGYTADGGQTFPFRGQFIGAMPSLGEVFTALPDTRFLINIKSRSQSEAKALAAYLDARKISDSRVTVYGHETPIEVFKTLRPDVISFSKQSAKACLKGYVLRGWSGHMPKACHNTWVMVPENYRWAVWGWPYRFEARLAKVGSRAVLIGPHTSARSGPAIDTRKQVGSVPEDFGGVVWTNRIEIIGPELRKR